MIIRKGMWATNQGRVGIIAGIGPQQAIPKRQIAIPAGYVHFDVVGQDGVTTSTELVDIRAVAQASYMDIPETRRPSEQFATNLGYL